MTVSHWAFSNHLPIKINLVDTFTVHKCKIAFSVNDQSNMNTYYCIRGIFGGEFNLAVG